MRQACLESLLTLFIRRLHILCQRMVEVLRSCHRRFGKCLLFGHSTHLLVHHYILYPNLNFQWLQGANVPFFQALFTDWLEQLNFGRHWYPSQPQLPLFPCSLPTFEPFSGFKMHSLISMHLLHSCL